jgi:methyltransferase (TIGR00027 family)
VGIDLREEWPTALRQAGFDRAEPSTWLAEGLMIGYLPCDAQHRMRDQITALSARGSQLTADHLPDSSISVGSTVRQVAESGKWHGLDVDFDDLICHKRNDVEKYLEAHG